MVNTLTLGEIDLLSWKVREGNVSSLEANRPKDGRPDADLHMFAPQSLGNRTYMLHSM